MKYSLKDMAEYFKPTSYGSASVMAPDNQTFWLSLGSCEVQPIANSVEKRKAVLTGSYHVNQGYRYDVYISLDRNDVKSNVISMEGDGSNHLFKFELIIPANSASKNIIFRTVDPAANGSILFTNMRLELSAEKNSNWTVPDTVAGCLTTIADWIRDQSDVGGVVERLLIAIKRRLSSMQMGGVLA